MNNAGNQFLDDYVREKLPQLSMGELETAPDGSGFTLATDLEPLHDPLSLPSMLTS